MSEVIRILQSIYGYKIRKIIYVPVEPVKVDPGGESEGDSLLDGPSKLFKLVADWKPDS